MSRTLSSICATGRPGGRGDDRVVEAVQPRRAVGRARWRTPRRAREVRLARSISRQLQVGVGTVGDGTHHRVGRQAGRVGGARPLPRAPRRSARRGPAARAGAGQSSPRLLSSVGSDAAGPVGGRPSASCRGAARSPSRTGAGRRCRRGPSALRRRASSPGAAARPVGARRATGRSLSRSPRKVRPGARRGGAAADLPVDGERRSVPAHPRVLDGDLGRERDALGRLRHRPQRAVLEAVERRDEQAGAGRRRAGRAGRRRCPSAGSSRSSRRSTGPVSRPSSRRNVDGAGHLVAGHARRAAPARRRARPAAARSAG